MSIRIVSLPNRQSSGEHWMWPGTERLSAFLCAHRWLKTTVQAAALGVFCVILTAATAYMRKTQREAPTAAPVAQAFQPVSAPVTQAGKPALPSKNITAKGRVVANAEWEIKSRVSGQIIRLPVDVSDVVRKGMVLVEFDPLDEQRQVKRAQTQLSASRARLEQAQNHAVIAEKNLAAAQTRIEAAIKSAAARAQRMQIRADRLKETIKMNFISKEQYDEAVTDAVEAAANLAITRTQLDDLKGQEVGLAIKREDIRCAETQLELDELDLTAAQQRLQETKIFAPGDGIVTARLLQPGQISAANQTLLTLADLSRVFVLASVDESSVAKITTGQRVQIAVDAFPEMCFDGKVERIASKGTRTNGSASFEVKIEVLDEKNTLLRPEMTAHVEIVAAQ